jgi:hypothetical protein
MPILISFGNQDSTRAKKFSIEIQDKIARVSKENLRLYRRCNLTEWPRPHPGCNNVSLRPQIKRKISPMTKQITLSNCPRVKPKTSGAKKISGTL